MYAAPTGRWQILGRGGIYAAPTGSHATPLSLNPLLFSPVSRHPPGMMETGAGMMFHVNPDNPSGWV